MAEEGRESQSPTASGDPEANATDRLRNPFAIPLVEVFSGIQGEGLHLGVRQVFLRLCGCNLLCAYCDTRGARNPQIANFTVCRPAAEPTEHPNPASLAQLVDIITDLEDADGPHHSLAVTGGEPLLHASALRPLIGHLATGGMSSYLETNGTLPDGMRLLAPAVETVAMDIKLPSATGEPWRDEDHRECLEAAAVTDVFVKLIVVEKTPVSEVIRACAIIQEVDRSIPCVIQPALGPDGALMVKPARLIALAHAAAQELDDVRVIPQAHRLLGLK